MDYKNDYDAIIVTYANSSDLYQFYRGGTSGAFVRKTLIIYTDTGKTVISKVVKT